MLLAHAERIETRILEATEETGHEPLKPSGTVRIATPEAFGSSLIVENLHILRRDSGCTIASLVASDNAKAAEVLRDVLFAEPK